MNPQTARYLFINLVSRDVCPSCRRTGFTKTHTLDGGRLYECKNCDFKLVIPKEMVKEVEKCPGSAGPGGP